LPGTITLATYEHSSTTKKKVLKHRPQDDFSSLSALLRFHRQQRKSGKKNLVAQLAANATSPPSAPSSVIRQHRRHRRYKMVTKRCDDRLGTYVRIEEPATVLQILNLKNRLVSVVYNLFFIVTEQEAK
jgi:hypothetical protein